MRGCDGPRDRGGGGSGESDKQWGAKWRVKSVDGRVQCQDEA